MNWSGGRRRDIERPRDGFHSFDRRQRRGYARLPERRRERQSGANAFELVPAIFAHLDSRDLGLDQQVVRPADHDQMFGIVAPHDDELALAIEIESIDNAEPGLARPPPRHTKAAAKQHLDNCEKQKDPDKQGQQPGTDQQRLII